MDRDAAGTYETQFVSQSDDEDTLYNVEKILDEKGRKYKVQWEGIDPATGKKWKPDWVWKTDCTDDLIADWKREKEERKRRAASNKSSSSASGSVTSRAPAAKSTATTSAKPKSRLTAARPSPPVSEAHSNSSAHTRTSAPSKRSSKFVIEVPARTGTKRPRESEVATAPLSPVKRLRLDGPASPLPASPFDDEDGGTTGKKRAGPVTYKSRKRVIGKSPLARKATGLLANKTSKVSSRNVASSSRAKPLYISSPGDAVRERPAASRKNQKAEQDSATEDEDSDPQLPDRLRPSKPGSSKAPAAARPATRSRRPSSPAPKSRSSRSVDPNPETFVRPHPTSSARTRPIPPRDPAVNRANQRDLQRSMRGDLPHRIRTSISAQNRFPKVVTKDREKPSGGTEPAELAGVAPGRNDTEVAQPSNPLSPPRSVSDSAPANLVSFRVEGVGDRDEFGPGGESERIMSSVESENAPALSQQVVPPSPRRSYGDATMLPQTGSQPHSQSQGNSSKGTVVPDSQAQAQKSNVPAKDPSPAKPHAAAPTSPAPVALPKPKLSTSRTRPKLRPSEMLRLGRGIVIKPRPSVAETESTLIESIPPELAAAHGRLPSESEYEPEGSGFQSEVTESNEVTPVTPGSSEETKTETEIDSNVDDDDEEIGRDGPSFRTRSQSFSQSRPKYQTFWPDSSPTRPKRPEFKGEEQAGALSPGENEADQEEVDERGPIPTSSPSLGGGRTGSVDLGSPESPTRRYRMTVEVVLPSPARPSQQTLSQATEAAASQEHVEQQELVTQETPLEDEGAQAQPDEGAGLENDQEDSPPLNDQDQSFAHAMEIDELLTDDASHQLGEGDMNIAAVAEGDPKHADTTGSVIDLSNTTADASDSILDLDLDATHTDNFMDHIQPVAEPPPALSSQPDSRIPASSSSFPQGPRATTPIPPAFLPPLLSDSSQSQRLPATLDPVPGSQNLASQPQLQPQSQPPSQPQDHTHSSIEETSSWSFPPPGQAPRPADTISSFTPTNPSVREPPTSGEHLPPSSNPFTHTTIGDNYGLEPPHTQSSTGLGPPSTFGPVPELSTEVFRRDHSPESDIGQFDSPMKATPTFLREESTTSPESRKALDAVLGIRFDRIDAGWVDSSGQSENKRMAEALKEAESKLAARDHRIVELTTELEQLAAEKSRAAAIFRDNMAQSEAIVQQQQEAYTLELADLAKTIADLRLQLMSAQTQSEIAESQRAAALEQYTIASNEVKPLADANRALNDRVRTLEKQVTAGLLHWQRGFESNMERKGQELKQLQAQLDLEREIRARTDGRDIRRRAAEWYELKKRVEDLEAESLQVEQEAQALRNREKELRLREQELAQREMALKNLPLQPSQSQGDRGLSQDDMQTETMLSDRSAVLAELDGPAGEDMVWMCTYRDSSDRLCGQAFETMGLLLTHVLDANGHKVDAGCQCG